MKAFLLVISLMLAVNVATSLYALTRATDENDGTTIYQRTIGEEGLSLFVHTALLAWSLILLFG